MSSLTSKDGKLIVRDGKLGTEQACCCDGTGACAGTCGWTNDPDWEGPPVGGWYIQVFDCLDEENCQCGDPVALCGEAPEYDFEDPDGTVAYCTTGCEANPLP